MNLAVRAQRKTSWPLRFRMLRIKQLNKDGKSKWKLRSCCKPTEIDLEPENWASTRSSTRGNTDTFSIALIAKRSRPSRRCTDRSSSRARPHIYRTRIQKQRARLRLKRMIREMIKVNRTKMMPTCSQRTWAIVATINSLPYQGTSCRNWYRSRRQKEWLAMIIPRSPRRAGTQEFSC